MWEMAMACNMFCYIYVFLNAVIEQSSSLWLIIWVKDAKLSTILFCFINSVQTRASHLDLLKY